MAEKKESLDVLLLTQSSKCGGLCVAGVRCDTGKWVRLVTDDENTSGAVPYSTMRRPGPRGKRFCVLDKLSFPIKGARPSRYQPENILLDETRPIGYLGAVSLETALRLHPVEHPEKLFGSTGAFISPAKAATLGCSLILIQATDLVIRHTAAEPGRQSKTKADFTYNADRYQGVSVTDPGFYSVPDGQHIKSAYLAMSIGEPYDNGLCYKFIAAVYTK